MSKPQVSFEVLDILRRRYGDNVPGPDGVSVAGADGDTAQPSGAYRYGNLTSAIADRASPLRRYLDITFPNTRHVTTPHIQASPVIEVSGNPGVNPGTLGTAFDNLVALRFQPDTIPSVARPYARRHPEQADAWADLLNLATADPARIYAAAWAYALACETYRSGITPPAVDDLIRTNGDYDADALLDIAPSAAIDQLARLDALAEEALYPHLGTPREPDPEADPVWRRAVAWTDPAPLLAGDAAPLADASVAASAPQFGPTFAASRQCLADADVISQRTLFEIKTRLGTTRKSGTRADRLQKNDLYQVVAYALFDTDDRYRLTHVALYSARYARLTRWPLNDLLNTLAGTEVDLAEQRASVWTALGGDRRKRRHRPGRNSP